MKNKDQKPDKEPKKNSDKESIFNTIQRKVVNKDFEKSFMDFVSTDPNSLSDEELDDKIVETEELKERYYISIKGLSQKKKAEILKADYLSALNSFILAQNKIRNLDEDGDPNTAEEDIDLWWYWMGVLSGLRSAIGILDYEVYKTLPEEE
jgi:hypothetical protein